MTAGKLTNSAARGREAVPASRREIAGEPQPLERVGVRRRDLFGREPAEKFAEQRKQPAHDRRFRVTPEVTPTVAQFADEPHHRHTAADPVGVDAFRGAERRKSLGPIDDEPEPLLRIVDDREVLHECFEFPRERHAPSLPINCARASIARRTDRPPCVTSASVLTPVKSCR